jgi:hypothetical protein
LEQTIRKPLIDESKIEETIRKISATSFTVLDFMEVFEVLHPAEWRMLMERYGLYGDKRRYTATTYLSNRLDTYSQKPHSLLIRFVRYKEGGFRDYSRTTDGERMKFGSPWIAVFRKRGGA